MDKDKVVERVDASGRVVKTLTLYELFLLETVKSMTRRKLVSYDIVRASVDVVDGIFSKVNQKY